MQLVRFSCRAFRHLVHEINLQPINLIVGRNGSGKSYALRSIERLADVISEKSWHPTVRAWQAEFKDEEGNRLSYSFGWADKGVAISYEELKWNDKSLIKRDQNGCSVYSIVKDTTEEVTPPETKLVINVRRDTKTHPEFEKLIQWAEASYAFRFGTIVPDITNISKKLSELNFSPLETERTEYSPGDLFDGLTSKQQKQIRDLMEVFGYDFEVLESVGSLDARSIHYTERGVPGMYDIAVTSQGTYRVFMLLLYLFRLINTQKFQLLLIDDLGEGLDYGRSVKLGKFIFDTCQKENIQLIATSNDGFLMDAIPIKYWNILRRKGIEVKALNEKNSPELFNNFSFTGLSNFDFFSSDYIDSHLK